MTGSPPDTHVVDGSGRTDDSWDDELEGTEPPPPHDEAGGGWLSGMPTARLVQAGVSVLVVASCVVFTLTQLSPSDLLSSSTPTGGDMGAHVWGPAFLRDHLLPLGRLSGWAPDWYAGFPAYHFYMLPPAFAIAVLSWVIPYGVAFKLVAVTGLLTLPVAAWACGRLTRLPFPVPPLMAVAVTMFLFDRSYSILGGNIASTLAGEFSFSISLSICFVYLGVLGRGLETGRHRAWAALLFGAVALTHPLPFILAAVGTVVWFFLSLSWARLGWREGVLLGTLGAAIAAGLTVTGLWTELSVGWVRFGVFWSIAAAVLLAGAVMVRAFPRGQLVYLVTTLPVGAALSAFWTLPFLARTGYMNDMGWEKLTDYGAMLFTRERSAIAAVGSQGVDSPAMRWVLAFAAVGILMAIVATVFDRNRNALLWAGTAATFAVLFVVMPDGRIWNARLLPFYYVSLYVLGAIGVGYVSRLLSQLFARDPGHPREAVNVAVALGAVLVALVTLAVPLRALPASVFGIQLAEADATSYRWWFLPGTTDRSFVPSWARWNFEGYEGKAAYPEYHDLMQTMGRLGSERGCGAAMWEHESEHNRFGTPMALMLLPFWTDGCIGSSEGLYFEAASTTPYHFLVQDELSSNPSNPQRDLPYEPGVPSRPEFEEGIAHLEMMGVRYYMAISERMIDMARSEPSLTEVATSGPWVVFEVAGGADKVVPLDNEPAVMTGLPSNGNGWLERTLDWYEEPENWSVFLAAGGPQEWQRIAEGAEPEQRPMPPTQVSNVETDTDRISFDVDRTGTPILVKTSYFPNWQVSGAEGPWRVTPNMMVVVPTSEHVELTYGWTPVDLGGIGLTMAGVLGLAALAVAPPVVMPRRRPEEAFDPTDLILGPVEEGSARPGPTPSEPISAEPADPSFGARRQD